jgi:deazaflavin-dependent oxidoreductase (nitroreductase family)
VVIPRRVARINRAATNRILGPLARVLPGLGVVIHRGRRSGREYRTPVNVFRTPDGYVIALTYGVGDWARNVLAAGGCDLEMRRHVVRLVDPRLVRDPSTECTASTEKVIAGEGSADGPFRGLGPQLSEQKGTRRVADGPGSRTRQLDEDHRASIWTSRKVRYATYDSFGQLSDDS